MTVLKSQSPRKLVVIHCLPSLGRGIRASCVRSCGASPAKAKERVLETLRVLSRRWAGEEQAGNSSDEGLDESMCGLSNYDVFSLGLLDPPPRIKEEDCSLTATLADPQLSTTAPQRQHSGTLAAQAEHADTGRPGQCNQHKMEPQVSSLRDQLRQFQYPPLMGEVWSHAPAYNNSSHSVFVPVSYAEPAQVCFPRARTFPVTSFGCEPP